MYFRFLPFSKELSLQFDIGFDMGFRAKRAIGRKPSGIANLFCFIWIHSGIYSILRVNVSLIAVLRDYTCWVIHFATLLVSNWLAVSSVNYAILRKYLNVKINSEQLWELNCLQYRINVRCRISLATFSFDVAAYLCLWTILKRFRIAFGKM